MIRVTGIYRWSSRPIGYRNDFCIWCGEHGLSLRFRTLYVWHFLFIPLLPIAFRSRWICRRCSRDPHHAGMPRSLRAVLTGVAAAAASWWWLTPPTTHPDRQWTVWMWRIAATLAFAAGLWWSTRTRPDVDLDAKLKESSPLTDTSCALCGAALEPAEPFWRCRGCGVSRQALR